MQPSPRLFPLENERGGKTRKARIVYDTGQNNFQLVVILLACIVREYVSIAACLKSFEIVFCNLTLQRRYALDS